MKEHYRQLCSYAAKFDIVDTGRHSKILAGFWLIKRLDPFTMINPGKQRSFHPDDCFL